MSVTNRISLNSYTTTELCECHNFHPFNVTTPRKLVSRGSVVALGYLRPMQGMETYFIVEQESSRTLQSLTQLSL